MREFSARHLPLTFGCETLNVLKEFMGINGTRGAHPTVAIEDLARQSRVQVRFRSRSGVRGHKACARSPAPLVLLLKLW